MLHQRRAPRLLGLGLGGLGGLDLGGERPWCGPAAPAFSSPCACGICLPSCFCSARLASKSAIACAPGGVGGEGPVHDVVGQAALGLGGAHAVGVVAEHPRVDHRGQGYPAREAVVRHAQAIRRRVTVSASATAPAAGRAAAVPAY